MWPYEIDFVLFKVFFLFNINILGQTVIVNIVPLLISLLADTLPPIYSIILLQILRPKPDPSKFNCYSSSNLLKSINNLFKFSFDIPIPKSYISIFIFDK